MNQEIKETIEKCVGIAQGDTGGSSAMRKILLSMYNAQAWPLDISEFRRLDWENTKAAHMLFTRFISNELGAEVHTYIENGDSIFGEFWEIEQEEVMYRGTSEFRSRRSWKLNAREAMIYSFGDNAVEKFEAELKKENDMSGS